MRFSGGVGLFFATFLLGCGPGPTTTPLSYRISVAKAGDGSGAINSVPQAFIHCGATCSANVARGIAVSLTAKADPGSTFEGWVDGCTGTGPCTPPINTDIQINALFKAKFSSVTVTLEGDGEGRVVSEPPGVDCGKTCSASFREAVQVMFRASAAPGSYFSGWRGSCAIDPSDPSRCHVAPENATSSLRASFSRVPPPLSMLNLFKEGDGNGVVRATPPGTDCGIASRICNWAFEAGTVVELTATPSIGSRFDHWTDGGTDPALVITTDDVATMVTATFSRARNPLTVVVSGAGSGTISGPGIQCGTNCSADLAYGASVVLTAAADAGSWFTGWSESSCGRNFSCFFSMTAARTVTGTFVPVFRSGNASPFSQSAVIDPDQLVAEQFVLASPGTVHGLGLILPAGVAGARLALYGDVGNLPGPLLAETGGALFVSGGAERALLTGPLSLPAGPYWIAATFEGNVAVSAQLIGSSSLTTSRSWPYLGPLPSPFGSTDAGMGTSYNFFMVKE